MSQSAQVEMTVGISDLPCGVLLLDATARIIHANECALGMLRQSFATLVGRPLNSVPGFEQSQVSSGTWIATLPASTTHPHPVSIQVVYSVQPAGSAIALLQDWSERQLLNDAIATVAADSGAKGEAFYRQLVQKLAEALDVRFAFIGLLHDDDPNLVTTHTFWMGGEFVDNCTYHLRGTPCEGVMDCRTCLYPDRVAERFPEDAMLADLGIQSYLGMPMFDANGKPFGLMAIMDVKPIPPSPEWKSLLHIFSTRAAAELLREQAETRQRRINEELEHRVALRTRELSEANQELEAFSYSVSHDLRAPLRHIGGYAEFIREIPDVGKHEEVIKLTGKLTDIARNMERLIDDLLTFAHAAKSELHLEKVSLDEVLAAILKEIEPEWQGRNIKWQTMPMGTVLADHALLKLALLNLIRNAVKYTRTREAAVIEIGVSRTQDSCSIHIRDNGVGFDPKYADKLFGVFQRLHSTRDFEGTGIGLANVKRIVERHGGQVGAESEPDKGAHFYIVLPAENAGVAT